MWFYIARIIDCVLLLFLSHFDKGPSHACPGICLCATVVINC